MTDSKDSKKPVQPTESFSETAVLKRDWESNSNVTLDSSNIFSVTNTRPAPPNPTRSATEGGKDKK